MGVLLSLCAVRKRHGTCLLGFVVMDGLSLSIYRRAYAIHLHARLCFGTRSLLMLLLLGDLIALSDGGFPLLSFPFLM